MSASATKKRRLNRAAVVCLLVSGFLYLFNAVYTQFSFGASSPYLARMYLIPLTGGTLAALLIRLAEIERFVTRPAFNAWNSGLATLTAGCAVRGVIEISGRFTAYDSVYWAVGFLCLIVAALLSCLHVFRKRKHCAQYGIRKSTCRRSANTDGPTSEIPSRSTI